MRLLLDTHAFLWIVSDDKKLPEDVKRCFLDSGNEIFISSASIWEMAIKISLGKLKIGIDLNAFVKNHVMGNDIGILNIRLSHIYRLENLPFHHRDPFDRLIICQAIDENLQIVSRDSSFDKYSVTRLW
ncbi:MAG TPA: type II toxin-antitoxin system VapC family toxin [Caldithrix abyssi]|uniref:Type II toxin-antitoxin system VapC family toxin n=1 Tax=Caldithrix abyssi TaxID=187145 RepID=A0A7V1LLG4_CALAY|nr:type II toxin-antitoxin system VapC family toxin [Caldithrix abyssi]